jgi:AcrR family transcriptional regulator
MPRKADPALEAKILDSALRLLDRNGTSAVSMRQVARAARTTTPTIYERFEDHEAILFALFSRVRAELLPLLRQSKSASEMGEVFLDYGCRHPHRLELIHTVWPKVLSTADPKPALELFRQRLRSEFGHSRRKAEEISLLLIALLIGTAVLMLGAEVESTTAKELRRAGMRAFRILCRGGC